MTEFFKNTLQNHLVLVSKKLCQDLQEKVYQERLERETKNFQVSTKFSTIVFKKWPSSLFESFFLQKMVFLVDQ